MKTLRNQFLIFAIWISLLSLFSCEKDDKFEFGDIQMKFEVDSIYQAASDGFLTVQFIINGMGNEIFVRIYSDNSENPSTIIGEMRASSTATLPIKKDNYWKVVKGFFGEVVIGFTPILNN